MLDVAAAREALAVLALVLDGPEVAARLCSTSQPRVRPSPVLAAPRCSYPDEPGLAARARSFLDEPELAAR